MASATRRRQCAAALIGTLALLAAIAIAVWATRSPPPSVAVVAPAEAPKEAEAETELVELVAPEPEPIQPAETDRSPIPFATESRNGFPFEREVHIALTVTHRDGSPAAAKLRFAQLTPDEKDRDLEWTFASATADSQGKFQYASPNRRELFALRILAERGPAVRREVQLTPPFPERLAMQLEPGGTLVVSVLDETGLPMRDLQIDAQRDGSKPSQRRVPFSRAATELAFERATPWPIKLEATADRVTDEHGVATFGPLLPGNWRVRLAMDRTPDRKLPEVRIRPGETTVLELGPERMSDMLAVKGSILNERGAPLARRTLFVRTGDHNPRSTVVSNAFGVFREWAATGERVMLEPRLEHPSERFDPPFWEGARGTQGVVFRRVTAGEWVDARLRVIERSTRAPISGVEIEYEIAQRSGKFGASRAFDEGELRASLPVAKGLLMNVSAPGLSKFTFESTALREQASAGRVLQIELEGPVPMSETDQDLGPFGH